MSDIFFTSDLHFRHKNILKFEGRPFETLEEMNNCLIDAWNKVVKKNDTVYNLGDFCFGSYEKWVELLEQLNGNIIHIKGNHDSSNTLKKLHKNGYLKEVHMVGHYLKTRKHVLHLTHYPMEIGNRPRIWSLHGHIHSQESKMLNQINLCVDSPLNFNRPFGQPIHIDELIAYLDYLTPQIEAEFKKERGLI